MIYHRFFVSLVSCLFLVFFLFYLFSFRLFLIVLFFFWYFSFMFSACYFSLLVSSYLCVFVFFLSLSLWSKTGIVMKIMKEKQDRMKNENRQKGKQKQQEGFQIFLFCCFFSETLSPPPPKVQKQLKQNQGFSLFIILFVLVAVCGFSWKPTTRQTTKQNKQNKNKVCCGPLRAHINLNLSKQKPPPPKKKPRKG